MKPDITVISSAKNAESFIEESVKSIFSQTYRNFEYIVMNDGSDDRTGEILDDLAKTDTRLKIIHNPTNLGIPVSCNKALKIAKGKYIARMDADDISLPERLEIQFNFMENNPNTAAISADVEMISESGKPLGVMQNLHDSTELRTRLPFRNSVINPVAMIRKDALLELGGYNDKELTGAEDYDIWIKLLDKGDIVNLDHVLLKYRIHPQSISHEKRTGQSESSFMISYNAINNGMKNKLDMESYRRLWYYCFKNEGIPGIQDVSTLSNMFEYAATLPHSDKAVFPIWREAGLKLMREGHIMIAFYLEKVICTNTGSGYARHDKSTALKQGLSKIILYPFKRLCSR